MSYTCFANHYDRLTGNVSYPERARYFDRLIRQYTDRAELILDLACGTGSLTVELLSLGYDVIGVDGSAEMLSVAASKAPGALFLCQDMAELNLYGTIDATICALDSLNHIIDADKLSRVIRRVTLFTAPDGLFLFDVNTVYKHREVLGCNTFFYENDDCCCVWQNEYQEQDHLVQIDLDFFVKEEGERYRRESESFCERAYEREELEQMLHSAGLEILAVYGDDTLQPPQEDTQRLIYVTRKLPPERGGIAANNTKKIRIRRK
ncbi:class I SAM-dependent methyltransferase [Clostridiaceae bacterium NSJ-31]|uniref:Class I SAM-dependent methyltransferase n=1 Tax=Ligaoa zhengdingensis TaxID=2763658 RepID=A0A926E0A1_9FIRM|nr:class I SAM-dependent methyltransferase [Ligaoa zhengdingensis]MBC8546804.1 class I SAM-dependent methyltransferase [Ligaoa zhengdingensis]